MSRTELSREEMIRLVRTHILCPLGEIKLFIDTITEKIETMPRETLIEDLKLIEVRLTEMEKDIQKIF